MGDSANDVALKGDQEPALVKLIRFVSFERSDGKTFVEESPVVRSE